MSEGTERGAASLPAKPHHAKPILEVRDLVKRFPITRGLMRRHVGDVRAVDGISFSIQPGEVLALVGESGCGKTTTGRCVLRAIDPTAGSVVYRFDGEEPLDVTTLNERELKSFWRRAGMVFQDPYSSLNPRLNVLESVGEPLITHGVVASRRDLQERVAALLEDVGLDAAYLRRYPHAFSGGQRQRIAIARALALGPRFLVADEPLSALDVSVQAQVLELMQELRRRHDLTYLFVSHNLAVVEYLADRVAVMYVGRIVELARTETLFFDPKHPYTEALLSAVPSADLERRGRTRIVLPGDVADPADPPPGCLFHPRCPYAQAVCAAEEPPLVDVGDGSEQHLVSCHFADTLDLTGIERGARRGTFRLDV